jgi:hypothetical protein
MGNYDYDDGGVERKNRLKVTPKTTLSSQPPTPLSSSQPAILQPNE